MYICNLLLDKTLPEILLLTCVIASNKTVSRWLLNTES